MELWLIRHGQTADNHLKILAGHLPGKLSELGVVQATKTGQRLAKEKFTEIYCSDLGRAQETLENILLPCQDKYKDKITYSDLLREKGAGVLQGQPLGVWKENSDKSGLSIRQYKAEEGESWEDVYNRADKFLESLIEKYVRKNQKDMITTTQKEEQKIQENSSLGKGKSAQNLEESKGQEFGIKGLSVSPVKVLPKSQIQTNSNQKDKGKEDFPKILIVTHGGFIMEFYNVLNYRKSKQKPIFLNNTKNCSINTVKISEVIQKEKGSSAVFIEMGIRNEVGHLLGTSTNQKPLMLNSKQHFRPMS